ncbi:MAG: hypothetical protein K9L30_09945 [Desulfobacterales bacterium]|nr:hypothetical protein [Desulfobacterales bacterium]
MTQRFGAVCMQLGKRAGNAMTRQERKAHMDYTCEMIDYCFDQYGLQSPMGVKLIVGPELSVYGWPSFDNKEMHEKHAIDIPGEETERLVEKAKEYNCYICPGSFAERDSDSSRNLVFNTQILVGPEGLLYRYRKIQPWWPQETSVSPHDLLSEGYDTEKYPLFPVVKTEIGNIGGFICYDCCFPEVARQLAFNGCEIFIGSTAWMDPYGRPPIDLWKTCCRSRSIENMAYGVYTGSGCSIGHLGSFPCSGASNIVDFEGRVLAEIPSPGDSLTYATLDIDALRDHRKHNRMNNFMAHLKIGAYSYLNEHKGWSPQPQFKDIDNLTLAEADEINRKEIERFWSDYYNEEVNTPNWVPNQWK